MGQRQTGRERDTGIVRDRETESERQPVAILNPAQVFLERRGDRGREVSG